MATPSTETGIVVGVDASASSAAAVAWAARDAELRDRPLQLVHVVPPITMPDVPVDYARYAEDRAHEITQDALKVARENVAPDRASQLTTSVLSGPIVSTLVEMSDTADMIVTGCVGESAVERVLLGSVSTGLVHRAHCPVAVIHNEASPSPQAPVVVGMDMSPTSELAATIAFDEASRRGVELVVLHAWSDMGPLNFASVNWAPIEWRNLKDREEKAFDHYLTKWRDSYPGVTIRPIVVADRPANRLLEQAEKAQLIVVGSHGRGAAGGALLGSVSTAIVHTAQIPVIVARQG
ncbi:universal stress protein [Mycolicibacterium austroafricanum]|uniref:universal stress protein n=1 Tax=Mycolicibacterium austroafricanum TaxID=39687 RepID=UPI001CA32522|nr:universal stress protein [Mycolicibacterium austroafricanum]QZT58189.1 universal stress protein [Mycolicibacterium austroafricanum]